MSNATPSTSTPSVQFTQWDWFVWTAIAGSLASVINVGIDLFLPLFIPRPNVSILTNQESWHTALFTRSVTLDGISGATFGLLFGLAIAIAWEPLVRPAAHAAHRWTWTMVIGGSIGGILTWMGKSFADWYIGRSLWLTFLCGLSGGGVIGLAQASVLWQQRQAKLQWIAWHTLTFAGAYVVLTSAWNEVSTIWLLPFIWFSVWGLYGIIARYRFEEITYHYPNIQP